jgi:hypothetical protein
VRTGKAVVFSLAALVGLAAGWHLAARHVERHKAALFSPNRFRRLAALSYLAGQESVETIRLLKDYHAWEPSVMLRRRAARMIRRMETTLA